ncbi:hypothetical protein [Algoriphagus sp.]|uniref:hypothetical protein n=1 Tax=Algoriphagus sp. TaxID=1872435 RepID=UPI00257EB28B|nr:hypothetical protein [Algoriphagus sp.]
MTSKHNRQRKRSEISKWITDPIGGQYCSTCGQSKKGHTEEICQNTNPFTGKPYKHHETT